MSNTSSAPGFQSTSTSVPVHSTNTSNTNPDKIWLDKFEGPRDDRRLEWRKHCHTKRRWSREDPKDSETRNVKRINRERWIKAAIDRSSYALSGEEKQPIQEEGDY